jgi:hypothetical protein
MRLCPFSSAAWESEEKLRGFSGRTLPELSTSMLLAERCAQTDELVAKVSRLRHIVRPLHFRILILPFMDKDDERSA